MPMYDYKCDLCYSDFEEMSSVENRATAHCYECGAQASKVMINPPRLDPNMDTPGARMRWKVGAQRRGRGRDMTSANRTVQDKDVDEHAHSLRAAHGENPYITH